MFDNVTQGLRQWLVGLFVAAIKRTARPEDRHAAIQWLLKSRDVLIRDGRVADKLRDLNALISSRAAVSAIAASVADAVRSYRTSSLPWPMKIAVPATLLAIPIAGGHGAGVAAFGSAIGLPVLLLFFLGTAGITSIIEAVVTNPHSREGIAIIVDRILRDEATRQASAAFKAAIKDEATAPVATPMPDEELLLRSTLLTMEPFAFERHVMSFFEKVGLEAGVTPRSNDFGMDGWAKHPEGLIVVQCKRYGVDHKVGRPALMNFKTVIADQKAFRGYVVTTSSFSSKAVAYGAAAPTMVLVDMAGLVRWHSDGAIL